MRLGAMQVRTRIYLGFGLLTAIGLAVALSGVVQLYGVAADVELMSQRATNGARIQVVSHLLETTRRGVARYRLDNNAAALADARAALTSSVSLLQAAEQASLSAERTRIYQTVERGQTEYAAALDQMVAASTAALAERDQLVAGGNAMKDAADKLLAGARATRDSTLSDAAAQVDRAILLLRVANWRFLATDDPNGPATFKQAWNDADAGLTNLRELALVDIQPLVATTQATLAA
jgi:hypothetical protein